MSIHCKFCSSTDLRISRFRMKDAARLIVLQYPMRCRVCRDRAYQPVLQVFKSRRNVQQLKDNSLQINDVQPN